jgi:hypothetical protein
MIKFMEGLITWENVTFLIALGGVAFGIYHFFRNPDVNADKRICLLEGMVKFERERNNELFEAQKNHLHTLQVGQDAISQNIQSLCVQIAKLNTIIDERIPKK